jgi:hypothetical protein
MLNCIMEVCQVLTKAKATYQSWKLILFAVLYSWLCSFLRSVWACLVGEMKIFGCHIGHLTGCRKGFSDTNEKTNFITHQETARRIFLSIFNAPYLCLKIRYDVFGKSFWGTKQALCIVAFHNLWLIATSLHLSEPFDLTKYKPKSLT